MAKMTQVQIRQLMDLAYEAKNKGESLSKVFDSFAKQTGRARGSIRNVYYSSLKQTSGDEKYKKSVLGEKSLSVAKIISFEDCETDFLLEKILIGVTFGKSVRRVISEMTENPKLALRYQNKYRNVIRFDRQRVQAVREKIIEDYGKCYDPYKESAFSDVLLLKLKREINLLCDKIALEQREENQKLKQKILELEQERKELLRERENIV